MSEVNDQREGTVVALELRNAFRQPGCPICLVTEQSAHRYLFRLLWESVNDMGIRLHLMDSLGFCPQHTWQLYHLAGAVFTGESGTHILQKAVIHDIATRLRRFQSRLPDAVDARWWQRGWRRLWATLSASWVKDLAPTRPCPVCECVADSEERNTHWLIEGCADPAFRAAYAASDGLCLAHLRQAVERAAHSDPGVVRILTELAVARLQVLDRDLSGHIRKRAWAYRHESMNDGEQSSAHRAAQFLGGQDPCGGWAAEHLEKQEYVPSRVYKQMGLRVDE